MEAVSDKDRLIDLVLTLNKQMDKAGIAQTRCLLATTLLIDVAERLGFTAWRWEGSVIWHNRKYVALKKGGYDFETLAKLPYEKREKRLDALEKRGMRSLHCLANQGDPEKDLGGHLCVIVTTQEETFFVDPTSHQFQRDAEPPNRPGILETPPFIVSVIQPTDTPEINYAHPYKGGMGLYLHAPVERYRAMLSLSKKERDNTALNPRRVPTLYESIEQALSLNENTNTVSRGSV